ncbi:MAG: lysine--tRNA ligase [Ardenticatenaceae bacterium]|nr:lysine--tRNA ligase [Ardenticatenaceae bacterium]
MSNWQPNALESRRIEKMEALRAAGMDPFPLRAERTHTAQQAIHLLEKSEADLNDGDTLPDMKVTVTGRIVSFRDKGKIVFAHIEDESGRIQLFVRLNNLGQESYELFKKQLDLGDFVQATGLIFRTRMGEPSVNVTTWKILSKALSPLPVAKEQEVDGEVVRYSAFSDVEERYRQRYADLAVNREVRDVFRARAKMMTAIRQFFDSNDFLEVETPVLQPIYGGAAARPFSTHHNQLKQELFLRISFELYLKRLLVGGYERVYEIGRDFRNEGVSFKHNPEFTQLEFYAAYWDYYDVMDFTERMIAHTAETVTGSSTIVFGDHTINLAPPWTRMTLREAIKKYAEIDYVEYPDAAELATAIKKIGGQASPSASWGKLVDGLLGDYVEPNLIQPAFITEYPRDISPFAKKIPNDPAHVERFEFFIGGMEMGNAFTELNDPLDQEQRFLDLQTLYKADEDLNNPIDDDYLRAMRYGMPPNGGFGMGIDRLIMLLADKSTIREVLLYPHLREKIE